MAIKKKFFGTDGVRGIANQGYLTPESALRLGQSAAKALILKLQDSVSEPPLVIIGKDTRRSGDMLESAIAAGFNSAGINVQLGGVIPTPAVSLLVSQKKANLGVVISASHNPPVDNGIKIFSCDGYKLSCEQEQHLENTMLSEGFTADRAIGSSIGKTTKLPNAVERYVSTVVTFFAKNTSENPLSGIRISLDTANGASYVTSPQILEKLGADLVSHFHAPDGDNINTNCGCTHPSVLANLVKGDNSDIGISHDGDADRILMCDENADPVDGDELMAIIGCHLLKTNQLSAKTLVATKMSNYGLDKCIEANGGKVERAEIGDRNVMESMRKVGSNFGGEPSGHIICRDKNTTGDGIIAALSVINVMLETGKPLSELRNVLNKFPQKLVNLNVSEKPPVANLKAAPLIAETEAELGTEGRVLIRYSGTSSKIRILVEGRNCDYVDAQATKIAEAIQNQIGV